MRKLIVMCNTDLEYKTKTASLQAIYGHLKECSDNFIPPLDTYVDIEVLSRKIAEKAVTFEVWENRKLIGLLAVYYNDFESMTGFITNVSVLPGHKGKNIAGNLLVQAVEYGRSLGFIKVVLELYRANLPAFKVYARNGFNVTGENGDKVIMERRLDK